MYGLMETIEIFSDDHSNVKFAHLTFEDSQAAYLALLDNQYNETIEIIRPADVHLDFRRNGFFQIRSVESFAKKLQNALIRFICVFQFTIIQF